MGVLQAGTQFHDLTLIRHCGCGAYGEVWLCRDITGQTLALKLIRKGRQTAELKGVAALRGSLPAHPNVLTVHHVAEDADHLWYTMDAADNLGEEDDYIPDTLDNRIRQRRELDVIAVMGDLIEGLTAIHEAGMVHRDIKPANILFIHGRAVLGDVGMVSADGSSLSLAGTLGFIPPEVRSGSSLPGTVGKAGDIYALGMVLYCMLTGNPPESYPGLPTDLPDTPLNRRLNQLACAICRRNAAGRLTDLNAIHGRLREIERLSQTPESLRERLARHKGGLAAAVMILLLLTAGTAWLCMHDFRAKPVAAAEPAPDMIYRAGDTKQEILAKFERRLKSPAMKQLCAVLRDNNEARLARAASPDERTRLKSAETPKFDIRSTRSSGGIPKLDLYKTYHRVTGKSGVSCVVPTALKQETLQDAELFLFPDKDTGFQDSLLFCRLNGVADAFGTDILKCSIAPEKELAPDDPVTLNADCLNSGLLRLWAESPEGYPGGAMRKSIHLVVPGEKADFYESSSQALRTGLWQMIVITYAPYPGLMQKDVLLFREGDPEGSAVWISLLCREERFASREYMINSIAASLFPKIRE